MKKAKNVKKSTNSRRKPQTLAELYAQAEKMLCDGIAEREIAQRLKLPLQKVHEIKGDAYDSGRLTTEHRKARVVRADTRFGGIISTMLGADRAALLRLERTEQGVLVSVAEQNELTAKDTLDVENAQ